MSTVYLPTGWATMTSVQIGTSTRNTNEPGGSRLLLWLDTTVGGIANPLILDFIDISLPSMQASAYSTMLLDQKKYATQGVSRIIASDQISGTIECSGETYASLLALIGAKGTARIEIPSQDWFGQWRVALLSVDGPALADGDRMTGSIVLTVTNTAADDMSEMAPVFGTYTAEPSDVTGPTMTPTA